MDLDCHYRYIFCPNPKYIKINLRVCQYKYRIFKIIGIKYLWYIHNIELCIYISYLNWKIKIKIFIFGHFILYYRYSGSMRKFIKLFLSKPLCSIYVGIQIDLGLFWPVEWAHLISSHPLPVISPLTKK